MSSFLPQLASESRTCSLQSRAEAVKHYESKVEYIRSNVENLQEMIQKKQENMGYLVNVMQMKLQEQTSAASKTSK